MLLGIFCGKDALNMKKNTILKISGILLTALIIFTFLSKTIYNLTLPEVSTVQVKSGLVPLDIKTDGEMRCEPLVDVTAGESWRISKVMVKNGDRVKAGDLLFTLDTRDLDIEIMSRDLDILRLQDSLDALDESMKETKTQAGRRALQRNINEITAQLALATKQKERYQYPTGGEVYAEADGIIADLAIGEGTSPSFGEVLVSIYSEGSPLTAHFSLPIKDGADFAVGDSVSVAYYTTLDDGEVIRETKPSRINSRELSGDGKNWEYSASVMLYEGVPLMDAEISFGNIDGEKFDMVAPVSSVISLSRDPFVFVLNKRNGRFGDEYYVTKVDVTVQASNPFLAALDSTYLSPGMEIIVYTSMPLKDGDIVTVKPS